MLKYGLKYMTVARPAWFVFCSLWLVPAWFVLCSLWLVPAAKRFFAMAGNQRNEAHMGPYPLGKDGGTLTASDRSEIFRKTGCSASVRYRQQWGERCLSISGPASWLAEAKRLAEAAIAQNGTEYGRAEPATSSTSAGQLEELRTRVDWLNGQQTYYNNQIWAIRGELQQMATKMEHQLQGLAAKAAEAHASMAQLQEELDAQKSKKRKKKEAKEKDNRKNYGEDQQKTDSKKAKDDLADDEEAKKARDEEEQRKKKEAEAADPSPSPTSPALPQQEVKVEQKKWR